MPMPAFTAQCAGPIFASKRAYLSVASEAARPLPVQDLSAPGVGHGRHGHARTKLPLRIWFWAIFLVARHKKGISAMRCRATSASRRAQRRGGAWVLALGAVLL
jgi:hypothetical protein